MKDGCIRIPPILLPVTPVDPKIGSPAFFTFPPRIHRLKRGDAILLDDVKFRDRRGRYRIRPRGLPFDGGSYPWITQVLFGWDPYDPQTLRTFAGHDCDYAVYDYLCNWPIPRKEIDEDMLDGLRCEQPACAWLKYRTVRKVGWIPFGIKSNDILMRQWLGCLWEGDKILDEWIAKIIRTEGV